MIFWPLTNRRNTETYECAPESQINMLNIAPVTHTQTNKQDATEFHTAIRDTVLCVDNPYTFPPNTAETF
jgi:hypothetical protein